MFFSFHFPDKTVLLQRKSNLIFNIFSMKAIKSINSLQKEWNTVGYSKEESPWKLFSWDPVLSRLQAWLSEERQAKGREETRCLFCCHRTAAEQLPWIIDCVNKSVYELELLNCCLLNESVRTRRELVPQFSPFLPVKSLLSNQRARLRSKVFGEAPGIMMIKELCQLELK